MPPTTRSTRPVAPATKNKVSMLVGRVNPVPGQVLVTNHEDCWVNVTPPVLPFHT